MSVFEPPDLFSKPCYIDCLHFVLYDSKSHWSDKERSRRVGLRTGIKEIFCEKL